jgi:hypothetical protein
MAADTTLHDASADMETATRELVVGATNTSKTTEMTLSGQRRA